MKPYNKENIPLAKKLRKNMTPWERKLWYEYLRYYPVRFQRQKAIGNYIVDFYCAKARLIVELDNSGHYEEKQEQADAVRTRMLEQMQLRVLRICNTDVDKNFDGVCAYIDAQVQESLPQSAAQPAPSSERTDKYCYALGVFDGVHMGHQALLNACKDLAVQTGCGYGVITFGSHPDELVKGQMPALINTPRDRVNMLKTQFGAEQIILLPFDRALMQTPWDVFYTDIKTRYNAAGFVCGSDFRFGYKGQGTAELLRQRCLDDGLLCSVVPEQTLDGIRISSTHIRQCIEAGQVKQAARFLGHPHRFAGPVVEGRHLGRTIGIPTANLLIPEGVVVPKFGVYACKAYVDGAVYMAVTNVGNRPTVGGHRTTVEPWLLDFEGDLYGKELTLEFYEFLRPEQKFSSLEQLKEEILKNAAETRKFFENK